MIKTNPFTLKPKKMSEDIIYNISTLFFKISLILKLVMLTGMLSMAFYPYILK